MKSYLDRLVVRRERSLVCEADTKLNRQIAHSKDLAAILQPLIGSEVGEVFVLVAMTTRMKVSSYAEIGRGGLASCAVAPADVLRVALLSGSPAFVVAHNHPSGDPTPSPEDVALTTQLRKCFKLIGLDLLDHVIVGGEKHFSFLDAGLMAG